MKITNKTHWRTDQLKAFISRIAKDELPAEGRKRIQITIAYNRQVCGTCSGYAYYGLPKNPGSVRIKVPTQEVDRVDMAMVIAHELAHSRGMRHSGMRGCGLYKRTGQHREIYAWAESLPLERRPTKIKKVIDLQAVRFARVLKRQKEWGTRLRRAQTALRTINQQVRYYEKAAAMKAKG